MAPKRELSNCEFCGRDTPNKSGICKTCLRGVTDHQQKESYSEKDRERLLAVNGEYPYDRYSELEEDIQSGMRGLLGL